MNHIYIQNRRKALGVSQAALAQKAGLARETVNRFERQGTDIGLEAFGRLLTALGLVMKIEPANEVAVQNWDQFEAERRSQLLAELRTAAAQGAGTDQFQAVPVNGAKVLSWGAL